MLPPTPHRAVLFTAYAAASLTAAAALPPPAAVALTATLWLGFVLSISFMEAWVKFRAPTLSKAAGVDAGRHVFAALNAVEAGLGVGLVAALVQGGAAGPVARLAALALSTLGMGIAFLTPALDVRARAIITASVAAAAGSPPGAAAAHQPLPPAWLHGAYVAGDAVKVACLCALVRLVGGPLASPGAGLVAAGRALAGG